MRLVGNTETLAVQGEHLPLPFHLMGEVVLYYSPGHYISIIYELISSPEITPCRLFTVEK